MQTTNPNTNNNPILPFMTLSPSQLRNMSESMLLRFSIDYHQLNNPNLKSLEAVSSDLGFTPQAVSNYIAGKGSIGLSGLVKLFIVTNCELIPLWIEIQTKEISSRKRVKK